MSEPLTWVNTMLQSSIWVDDPSNSPKGQIMQCSAKLFASVQTDTTTHMHTFPTRNAALKGQSIKFFLNSWASQRVRERQLFPLLADSIFARYGWEKDSMQWEEKEKPVGGRKVWAKGTESTFTGGFTKAQGWGGGWVIHCTKDNRDWKDRRVREGEANLRI